jgi:S-adenosylmethionine:diacylglycerol 3-amino-3-carboxypropyl transferase
MSLPLFFTKKLIYTISWEDVTIDQKLLQLDHTSSILTIASAGDHLFNYALEGVF